MLYDKTDILKKVIIGILVLCILFALIDLISTIAPISKELSEYRSIQGKGYGSGRYYGSYYGNYRYDRYVESELDYLESQIGKAWLLFFCHSAGCVGICLLLCFMLDKAGTGVIDYVDQHIGFANKVFYILIFAMAGALLLAMISLCSDNVGLIIAASCLAGCALMLIPYLYVGCWFSKAAILKGYIDGIFFWLPFLCTVVGYLLVIAMPPALPKKAD